MAAWWYTSKDEKTGPVESEELKQLLQAGKIEPKTMLWKEGMDSWQPLDAVDELQALRGSVPPSLPSVAKPNLLTYPLATRWPRFFARIFDIQWELSFIFFILSALFWNSSSLQALKRVIDANFGHSIETPLLLIYSLIALSLNVLFDAFLYKVAGNTPGKALLGLKVATLDGKPLCFGEYCGRNLSVWITGLALGLPFISPFTMLHQAIRLGRGQQASYDEALGYRVYAKPIGWIRKSIFGVALVTLFLMARP